MPSGLPRRIRAVIQELDPPFDDDETLVLWGPVKLKAEWTETHPLGRASGVYVLTNRRLWYFGTTTMSGLRLENMAALAYSEQGRTGYLDVTLKSGATSRYYESRKTMRPLAETIKIPL